MRDRAQITLADEQYARLVAESRGSRLALAELVRRAIEERHGSARPDEALHALDASFGAWTDRSFDGASYVEGPRRGLGRRLAG